MVKTVDDYNAVLVDYCDPVNTGHKLIFLVKLGKWVKYLPGG